MATSLDASGKDNAGTHSVKQFNDRIRKARKIVERRQDRFSFKNPKFIERYMSCKLEFGIRCILGNEAQHGFTVSFNVAGASYADKTAGRIPEDSHLQRDGIDDEQSTVFTQIVKLMECPHKIIPSAVRFQRFDDLALGFGEPLYEFSPFESFARTELRSTRSHREVMLVRPRYAVAVSKAGSKNVERASDCVDERTNFHTERKREQLFFDHHQRIVSGISIYLSQAQIEVAIKPEIEPLLKGWELGYGPINASIR